MFGVCGNWGRLIHHDVDWPPRGGRREERTMGHCPAGSIEERHSALWSVQVDYWFVGGIFSNIYVLKSMHSAYKLIRLKLEWTKLAMPV